MHIHIIIAIDHTHIAVDREHTHIAVDRLQCGEISRVEFIGMICMPESTCGDLLWAVIIQGAVRFRGNNIKTYQIEIVHAVSTWISHRS